MARVALLILIGATAFSGCAVHEVHKDQDLIRTTLLDLYTNQIMDNLVRAKNGMPIIQLDYSNAVAQVTITNSIGGSDSQTTSTSNVLALPGAALTATRGIMTTLMGNASNVNANQIGITATPVTTSNEVYDAYLQYLDETRNPGSLMVSCDPPEPGTAHICKKFNGAYYYVPVEYTKLFFQLSLLTTSQRGKALQGPDEYYTSRIQRIVSEQPGPVVPQGQTAAARVFLVELDKKIPNDTGYLKFVDDKGSDKDGIVFTVLPSPNPALVPLPDATDAALTLVSVPTELVDKDYNVVKDKDGKKVDPVKIFMADIPGTARIYLKHKQPQQPTSEDLLNRVNFQLQQIQFNQLRNGSGP